MPEPPNPNVLSSLTIVAGSTQIAAAARAVIVAIREQDDDAETRLLVVPKLNGAKPSEPIAFTTAGRSIADARGAALRDDRGDIVYVPVIAWLDRKVTRGEAAAAAAGLPANRDEAADTLRAVLADGPMRSTALEAEMIEAGFSHDQTKRARHRIGAGVIKVANGPQAGWWTLPPGTPKAEGLAQIEEGSAHG